MDFTVQVHDAEEGGYWAEVAEIPGCVTQGDTAEELEANLKEVIEMYFEGFLDDYVESLKERFDVPSGDSTWRMSLRAERVKTTAKA